MIDIMMDRVREQKHDERLHIRGIISAHIVYRARCCLMRFQRRLAHESRRDRQFKLMVSFPLVEFSQLTYFASHVELL